MSEQDIDRVLLVDDDQAVLDGLCRQHRKEFSFVQACGPAAALQVLTQAGPFAVVVSDYQMPGMNGADLLGRVQILHPEVVRIMLTGQTDLATAVDGINKGHIFRFLTKPCDPGLFRSVLSAGLEQYHLINAERLLLEQTVKGSIEVLVEVLALSSPSAFGRATRIRHYVRHVVAVLELPGAWQYETAALLSQVGCVAIPNDIFERVGRGEILSREQQAMLENHPQLAFRLLSKIPRLSVVAEVIRFQQTDRVPGPNVSPEVRLGSRILAAAMDYEDLLSLGALPDQAMAALRESGSHGDRVLNALATAAPLTTAGGVLLCSLSRLRPGMLLEEDVRNTNGQLIVSRGHELTFSSVERLRNYGELGLLKKTDLRVRTPQNDSDTIETEAA